MSAAVLLLQLDGTLPNLALMRLAAHHRRRGDRVELRRISDAKRLPPRLSDPHWNLIYGSVVFEKTRLLAARARDLYPSVILGGPGWDLHTTLEAIGITSTEVDYSDFPDFRASLGYTQRGCRLRCPFCVVPEKEGRPTHAASVAEIWRGNPWPREILLLDNDFFGGPAWPDRVEELRSGFRVCLTQGINVRLLTEETAAAVASLDYRAKDMRARRLYAAWDRTADEDRVFRGLELLVKHGVKPAHLMVYMLIGYDPGETHADREYRRRRLRDFGALPYPMIFRGKGARLLPELSGFQRWVVGSYDKRISWAEWLRAKYQPRNLVPPGSPQTALLPSHAGHVRPLDRGA